MEQYRRRNYFIDKSFQTKFIVKFSTIVVVSSLIIGLAIFYLSANFTTVAIENAHVIAKKTSDFMLPMLAVTIMIVTLFSAAAVIILTLFTSHKIAGPLFRLKRDIESFKGGVINVNFSTRSTDQLKDLSASLSDMGKVLDAKHLDAKNKLAELKECLQKPGEDRGVIAKKIDELESALSYFKT